MTEDAADWGERGRSLAARLLASGLSPFSLSDLRFRFGVLVRHFGAELDALGPRRGEEAGAEGVWARHVDGAEHFLSPARVAAENAFNRAWDAEVGEVLRARTRDQRLPGDGEVDEPTGLPRCLVTLGLDRGCTVDDVKRAYRERALAAHPDVGGDHQLFLVLGEARDAALRWLEARRKK